MNKILYLCVVGFGYLVGSAILTGKTRTTGGGPIYYNGLTLSSLPFVASLLIYMLFLCGALYLLFLQLTETSFWHRANQKIRKYLKLENINENIAKKKRKKKKHKKKKHKKKK